MTDCRVERGRAVGLRRVDVGAFLDERFKRLVIARLDGVEQAQISDEPSNSAANETLIETRVGIVRP